MPIMRRTIKNVVKNYTDIQVKVREATSNDPWGPSSTLMSEIAYLTYNVVAFTEIMQMIWKRLNDHGKNWRHVYKSLTVLDYIIKTGSDKVAQQCKENIYTIQTLKDFQYTDDNKDQGINVREKAKQLVMLLKDDERLKNERAKAMKAKERFAQNSQGVVSHPSQMERSFSWSTHTKNMRAYQAGPLLIRVYEADILDAPVRCIVNAANEDLQHCGGIALAIARAAGDDLSRESQQIIRDRKGPLRVCEVVSTSAGRLGFECVLHAVGPYWGDYKPITEESLQACEKDLFTAVYGCLEKADGMRLRSIAIPAVSSALFAVPIDICCEQYAKAILLFAGNQQHLEEIHFVDIDVKMVQKIQSMFQTMITNGKPSPYISRIYIESSNGVSKPKLEPAESPMRMVQMKKMGDKTSYTFSKSCSILVYTGDILSIDNVDAMVCSEDCTGKAGGIVARKLLTIGGTDYSNDKNRTFSKKPQFGEVLITKGGRSKFKRIMHAIVVKKSPETLFPLFERIFNEAFLDKFTTVAMPLLGTGSGKSSPEPIAGMLFDSFHGFCKTHPNASIIVFVVNIVPETTSVVNRIFKVRIDELQQRRAMYSATSPCSEGIDFGDKAVETSNSTSLTSMNERSYIDKPFQSEDESLTLRNRLVTQTTKAADDKKVFFETQKSMDKNENRLGVIHAKLDNSGIENNDGEVDDGRYLLKKAGTSRTNKPMNHSTKESDCIVTVDLPDPKSNSDCQGSIVTIPRGCEINREITASSQDDETLDSDMYESITRTKPDVQGISDSDMYGSITTTKPKIQGISDSDMYGSITTTKVDQGAAYSSDEDDTKNDTFAIILRCKRRRGGYSKSFLNAGSRDEALKWRYMFKNDTRLQEFKQNIGFVCDLVELSIDSNVAEIECENAKPTVIEENVKQFVSLGTSDLRVKEFSIKMQESLKAVDVLKTTRTDFSDKTVFVFTESSVCYLVCPAHVFENNMVALQKAHEFISALPSN